LADIVGPDLAVLFVGINPGLRSAAAGLHFANPRNDFWRLLADSGLTPRLLDPAEGGLLPSLGLGITNAAARPTRGSGDLRRADFAGAAERLERLAVDLRPAVLAFVGKARLRGGVPRTSGTRAVVASARRGAPVRAALHVARQRRRSVRGAPALVHGPGRDRPARPPALAAGGPRP
jgi:TDG/mug DNA glycosylase family protein